MIKIAYDHQIFNIQKYGGISRYLCQLASSIGQNDDFDVCMYAGLYQNKFLLDLPHVKIKGIQIDYPPKTGKIIKSLDNLFARLSIEIDCPDVIHETYYGAKRLSSKYQTVITVHDMIHEKFANSIADSDNFIKVKAAAIKNADRIVCVSNNTKKDLLEMFDLDERKVTTIYLGHSALSDPIDNGAPLIPQPYLLFVGARSKDYKNFHRLVQAYGSSPRLQTDFKLVCFGSDSFSRSEITNIQSAGIDLQNVLHYTGHDSILANLYINASALIYPSLYEGFGIPPLEAMSFDCPVVCSNTSSIPEVVANAGEYFDPYDLDSIIAAIEKVVFSTSASKELVDRGKQRVKLFNWKKCAEETETLYRQLV